MKSYENITGGIDMSEMKDFLKDAYKDAKEGAKLVHELNVEGLKAAHTGLEDAVQMGSQLHEMVVNEIKNPTPIEKDIEKKIEERLFNGFNNWNGGYDGWLEWCNTLYEPDAYYNVYGKRLTLQQYKDMMGQLFQHYTMELGQFDNMIIRDNWCAIRYTVKIKNLHTGEEILQNTMEFVKFKENPEPIGVRVAEGWALSDSPLSAK